jgi:very-short-patch-repair endonuclease
MAKASFLASQWLQVPTPTAFGKLHRRFCMFGNTLVVEVDGGQHDQQADYDSHRDDWLSGQGFVVLRFWNNDVLNNIDGVMEVILKHLQGTPYLSPSPQGGRRRTKK